MSFLGSDSFYIPNNPSNVLYYEYGMVLDTPIVPWTLLTYTSVRMITVVLVAILCWIYGDYWDVAILGLIVCFLNTGLKLIGIVYVVGVVSWRALQGAGRQAQKVRTNLVGFKTKRDRSVRRLAGILLVASAIIMVGLDAWNILVQLAALGREALNLGGYNVNPDRVLTICLINLCFDF